MAEYTKRCPSCGLNYEEQDVFCQSDGTRLVEFSPQAIVQGASEQAAALTNPSGKPSPFAWFARIPKETRAGLFLFLGVALILALVFGFRKASEFSLSVYFDEGHGLNVGDSVFVKGTEIGEVKSIGFEGDRFLARMTIQPEYVDQLRKDSMVFIDFEKVAMQKYCVHIFILDPASPRLEANSKIEGEDSIAKAYTAILKRKGLKAAADFAEDAAEFIGMDNLPKIPGITK